MKLPSAIYRCYCVQQPNERHSKYCKVGGLENSLLFSSYKYWERFPKRRNLIRVADRLGFASSSSRRPDLGNLAKTKVFRL